VHDHQHRDYRIRYFRRHGTHLDEYLQLIPGPPVFAILILHGKEPHMASIEVPDNSPALNATVRFLDAEGYETPADDVPGWSTSDFTVADIAPSADGLTCTVEIGGPGVALITVTSVEANTGNTVVAQGTITVTPGDAVIGDVTFETPTP
jgi:hypothetical protein